MNSVKKIIRDFIGIFHVMNSYCALKWVCMILLNFPRIAKEKNLQAADSAMGKGPFRIRIARYGVDFQIFGSGAMSGIREMYVRDTYLRGGTINIGANDVVMDLGANMGNFTNLALAHGNSVRVISVEPSKSLNESFKRSIALNRGFGDRVQLIRAFLGSKDKKQENMLQDPEYADADWIGEDELLSVAGISRIDFLKCDIEGAEFGLLHPNGKILQMAQKIAIEVHHFAGDVEAFLTMLEGQGFQLRHIQRDWDGTVTVLGARS